MKGTCPDDFKHCKPVTFDSSRGESDPALGLKPLGIAQQAQLFMILCQAGLSDF